MTRVSYPAGALLYIRDDFPAVASSTKLQEAIVSTAVLGAALGTAVGGSLADRLGRKRALLAADLVFTLGALAMAAAWGPGALLAGRLLVGLGVGVASMAVPLYIVEAAPARVRGALVSVNVLMITTGQLASYLVNVAFTEVPGTWRWMLGIAGVPAVKQVLAMLPLPESPRWLFKQGRTAEAVAVLTRLRTAEELKGEVDEMMRQEADAARKVEAGGAGERGARLADLFATKQMRMAMTAGVDLQVPSEMPSPAPSADPTIVELAGFASRRTALLLLVGVAAANALGSVAGTLLIDRCGRRQLALGSLAGVAVALALLAAAFHLGAGSSPGVVAADGTGGGGHLPGLQCPGLLLGGGGGSAGGNVSGGSGGGGGVVGYGAGAAGAAAAAAAAGRRRDCYGKYGWLALAGLAPYIAAFAPGMGPVPWAVKSEIYPLRLRGLAGGAAATANWLANLPVAQTFLSLVRLLGASCTFLSFDAFAVAALAFVALLLPETRGLQFQQMDAMWEERAPARAGWLAGSWREGGARGGAAGAGGKEQGQEERAGAGLHATARLLRPSPGEARDLGDERVRVHAGVGTLTHAPD
eukprot:jgi/Mesen1/5494/ME000276S04629